MQLVSVFITEVVSTFVALMMFSLALATMTLERLDSRASILPLSFSAVSPEEDDDEQPIREKAAIETNNVNKAVCFFIFISYLINIISFIVYYALLLILWHIMVSANSLFS